MDYKKQATDFLSKHHITYKPVFITKMKYFLNDKKPRNVYEAIFERANKQPLVVRFGDSIINTEKERRCVPSAYDVLACLQKNEPEEISEFISEFGYEKNIKAGLKIHALCVQQWKDVIEFFTADEIEELQDIN